MSRENRFDSQRLWIEIKDDLNNTKHDYRCASSVTSHPTFQSTRDGVPWISSSLIPGLVVVVRRVVHCGRRTSLLPDFLYRVTWKNMAYERKRKTGDFPTSTIWFAGRSVDGPDVPRKVQIILKLKYPQLRNRWDSDLCLYYISDWESHRTLSTFGIHSSLNDANFSSACHSLRFRTVKIGTWGKNVIRVINRHIEINFI
jgi:hypothetical protein